jgi:hypothetical protein
VTVPAFIPPLSAPVWWPGVWCAVLLLVSEWALSLIEAYAAVTSSLASPAWVIPAWLFLTPIGLAAAFILGCWVACRGDRVRARSANPTTERAAATR